MRRSTLMFTLFIATTACQAASVPTPTPPPTVAALAPIATVTPRSTAAPPTPLAAISRSDTQPAAPPVLASRGVGQAITPARTPTPPADPRARERWVLQQAEAAFDTGRYADALAILEAGPVATDALDLVALRRAELALNLGDQSRARAELARAELKASTNRILLTRAAEAAERAGDFGPAGEFWMSAARQPTWQAEKLKAVQRGAAAFARAGLTERAVKELRDLIERQAGASPVAAVAELRRLGGLTPFHAGLIARSSGNLEEAAASFRTYIAARPTGEYAAAAQKQLESVEALQRGGGSSWSAATRADTPQAYRAFREQNPGHSNVPDSLFREGLAHYRLGDYGAAAELFSAGAAPEFGGDARARALYWLGKAFGRLDRAAEAEEMWRSAAAMRPSNYYTVRSADRLKGVSGWPSGGAVIPASKLGAAEVAEAQGWIATWSKAPPRQDSDAIVLRRAALFAGLELTQTAGADLDALIESTDNPYAVLQAGQIANEHALWLSSVRAGLRLGRMGPTKSVVDAPAAVKRLAYPSGYRDLVAAESARRDIGPLLLLSLIRQESLFDRLAVSLADARGLTQVMPATGAEIARAVSHGPFKPDDLFDPAVSVAFGARYVSGQITAFNGDVFRAVAAYNAGGGAARKWAPDAADPDLFVESIAYSETREYVKAVYLHHAAYRSLAAS